jgi:acetoin utilization protein AcuC
MIPNFYLHPETTDYSFGPRHPLKPERLHRTMALLHRLADVDVLVPAPATPAEVALVHSPAYVEAIAEVEELLKTGARQERLGELSAEFGLYGDNPPFPAIYRSSLAYVGATLRAAEAVRVGEYRAFGIGGGLHHAMRARASGFCIFNDPAIAVAVLRQRFDRVAYIDIDVHHGDGVQQLWLNDPAVLTASIHEDPRTLWPGTGYVRETGTAFTSVNVPIPANATGDAWRLGFGAILSALARFKPEAIVLQLGTDAHYLDPLAHLRADARDWLWAVQKVHELGLPTVAVGGGGYNLTTVPRMWTAAILTLSGLPVPEQVPEDLRDRLQVAWMMDQDRPEEPSSGYDQVAATVKLLERDLLPFIPGPA